MTPQHDPETHSRRAPTYLVIAEDLQRKIASGELAPGAKLPTELELRDQYPASRNIIRDAVNQLISSRLVEVRPHQGVFVADPLVTILDMSATFADEGAHFSSGAAARSREHRISEPGTEIQIARGVVASELQLEAGASVISRHYQSYVDNAPWSLNTFFYPRWLLERGAYRLIEIEVIPAGVGQYIEKELGIKQTGARDVITARPPDENERQFFDLPHGSRVPIVEIRRTAVDQEGRPFRLAVASYPADRMTFVTNLGTLGQSAPSTKGLPAD